MSQVSGDRVLETTTTTGTGNITTAGAVSGYVAFPTIATVNGDTFYYSIALGTEWEVGLGTRVSTAPFVFARTTILASSNAGAAVNFSPGVKEVWMDIPARLVKLFTPSLNPGLINGKMFESHAGNAVTYAIKTLAGNDPTAADPVFFVFGASDGTTNTRIVTAALSITIASGATMGTVNGDCVRIWLAAIDNAGTVELAVRNCYDSATGNIKWFPTSSNRITTTVQAGANDDLALTTYSVTARTAVPFLVLGHFTYDTTLITAGTWAVSPVYIAHYSPQMPKSGDVIQTVSASANTPTTGVGASTFIDSTVAVTITPTSFSNAIRVRSFGGALQTQSVNSNGMRLRNTTLGVTVGPAVPVQIWAESTTDTLHSPAPMYGIHKPLAETAQTYKIQFYDNTSGTHSVFTHASTDATLVAEEIMT